VEINAIIPQRRPVAYRRLCLLALNSRPASGIGPQNCYKRIIHRSTTDFNPARYLSHFMIMKSQIN
jgi:hypothetical protein